MVSPNFRQLPRYQKKVRQRENVREAQGFAVPHIDDIVSEEGGQQAAREEFGKGRAQQLDLREKSLDLSKRRFDLSKDLTAKRETANRRIADRNFAINREILDIRDEQNKWGTGLEIANIGVEAMGAISNVRAAEEEAKQTQLITNSFLELLDLYSEGLDPQKRGI